MPFLIAEEFCLALMFCIHEIFVLKILCKNNIVAEVVLKYIFLRWKSQENLLNSFFNESKYFLQFYKYFDFVLFLRLLVFTKRQLFVPATPVLSWFLLPIAHSDLLEACAPVWTCDTSIFHCRIFRCSFQYESFEPRLVYFFSSSIMMISQPSKSSLQ